MAYDVGNFKIDLLVGNGNGPGIYVPSSLANQADNTAVTATTLGTSAVGGNGVASSQAWLACSGTSTSVPMTYQAAAYLPLSRPIDVIGTYYTGFAPTVSGIGIRWDLSVDQTNATWSCRYKFNTFSPVSSMGYWTETPAGTPLLSTAFASMSGLEGTSDFTNTMWHAGTVYLETAANPNGTPNVGSPYTYTAGSQYFISVQYQKYDASSIAGGVYLVAGAVTSGAFTANESLSQATSGASATLMGTVSGSTSMQLKIVSGTADATHIWTGGTSSAQYTPTAIPKTFHTWKIYDSNCGLLATLKKVATSGNAPANDFFVGRLGDVSTLPTGYIYMDQFRVNYARGDMLPCQ